MSNIRLLSFSYSYSITEADEQGAKLPAEVKQAINHLKYSEGVTAPTPVPTEMRNKDSSSESSSLPIPLRDIERVLPIYLRVYFKEDGKTKRALVEYEVKNNETVIDMLSAMLRKLKILKGQAEASGRVYYTQRKFRNPSGMDFKNFSKTVIEDIVDVGKSLFFVFDMVGRLDKKELEEDKAHRWVVPLQN